MTTFYDKELEQELNAIPAATRESYMLADKIASRIEYVMKEKNVSKKQLAEKTHKRPSEITKWLAGGHNFTCKTIGLIQQALGAPLIEVAH
ncbi:MAG: helix-turn-helix transcriptional regulator [Paludibacteraceae bacterium]|nr:helix-turn-helix transcriptional regulator [Paludibacteraceae bacterium]